MQGVEVSPRQQGARPPRSSGADAVRLAVAQQHDRLDVDAYTLGARVQARIRERAHGPRQGVRLISRAGAEIGQRAPWLQSRRRVRWRPRRPSLQRRRWRQYEWRRRPACSKRIYPKGGGVAQAPARPPASGIAAGAGLVAVLAAWALQRPWSSTRGALKPRCRAASQRCRPPRATGGRTGRLRRGAPVPGLLRDEIHAKSIALMRGSKGGPCSSCARDVPTITMRTCAVARCWPPARNAAGARLHRKPRKPGYPAATGMESQQRTYHAVHAS